MRAFAGILLLLFAIALAPLRAASASGMPLTPHDDCPAAATAATTPCGTRPTPTHPATMQHDACCQVQLAAETAMLVTPVPMAPPRATRHDARFSSFIADAQAPPPRA